MKVYICTVDCYDDKIIEYYPCLKNFGFGVKEITRKTCKPIRDENLGWIMQEYERICEEPYILLESLDDLIKLREGVGESLIFDATDDGGYSIEIYDDYRE